MVIRSMLKLHTRKFIYVVNMLVFVLVQISRRELSIAEVRFVLRNNIKN